MDFKIYDDIYPLTVIKDRYSGAFSGGEYTAWKLEINEIPTEIFGEDPECQDFWYGKIGKAFTVGKGKTMEEAVENLRKKLIDESKTIAIKITETITKQLDENWEDIKESIESKDSAERRFYLQKLFYDCLEERNKNESNT